MVIRTHSENVLKLARAKRKNEEKIIQETREESIMANGGKVEIDRYKFFFFFRACV